MIKVNLSVGSRYPVNRNKIRQKVKEIFHENKVKDAQIDVSIVGKRKIKQLNEDKMGREGTTDVLSFPQYPDDKKKDQFPKISDVLPHYGDVVVSFPAAVDYARKYGKLVDEQICNYIEHGIMHLLGFHHE